MKVVLSGLDAAAWSLVALQVVLERAGHEVWNVGPRAPVDSVLRTCRWERPGCLVLSTAVGAPGVDVLRRVRGDPALAGVAVVIGGRLSGTREGLLELGFDEVFPAGDDPAGAVAALRAYLVLGAGQPASGVRNPEARL
ncbi:cobalamin-dependent protein [Amycolatopsis sp. MtRt-6]|uniref:cobalamin-dependent protein n=1 Tax=Amycolatopsis sp. MtRt-6 TaxID=2792782 RepID=UPI001A8E8EE9|nr:cobalamin-dependent protein [Amycolatopsis sp. MtRt-6]